MTSVVHPRKAELVKLRYFVGMTFEEAASVLGIAVRGPLLGAGFGPAQGTFGACSISVSCYLLFVCCVVNKIMIFFHTFSSQKTHV